MYEEGQLCPDCGGWMPMTHSVSIGDQQLYVYQCTDPDCRKVLLGYALFRITPIDVDKACPECHSELEFVACTDDRKTIFVCKNEYGKHKVTVESYDDATDEDLEEE